MTIFRDTFTNDELRNEAGELRFQPEQCQNEACGSMAPLTEFRRVIDGVVREGWLCNVCDTFHPCATGFAEAAHLKALRAR